MFCPSISCAALKKYGKESTNFEKEMRTIVKTIFWGKVNYFVMNLKTEYRLWGARHQVLEDGLLEKSYQVAYHFKGQITF